MKMRTVCGDPWRTAQQPNNCKQPHPLCTPWSSVPAGDLWPVSSWALLSPLLPRSPAPAFLSSCSGFSTFNCNATFSGKRALADLCHGSLPCVLWSLQSIYSYPMQLIAHSHFSPPEESPLQEHGASSTWLKTAPLGLEPSGLKDCWEFGLGSKGESGWIRNRFIHSV